MGFSKILPVIILLAILILGAIFLPKTLGSLDKGSNVSSAYQDQYNGTRDVTITTISFTKFLPPIFGAIIVIIAVVWLGKSFKR